MPWPRPTQALRLARKGVHLHHDHMMLRSRFAFAAQMHDQDVHTRACMHGVQLLLTQTMLIDVKWPYGKSTTYGKGSEWSFGPSCGLLCD